MDAIAAGVIDRVPERAGFLTRNGWGAAVVPLTEEIVGTYRPALRMLWGAVALVLLIVCANVANLLLARAERRSGELSLRRSLGASGGRLVRQLLTESGLLALLGTVVGLGVARALLESLPSWVPGELPGIAELGLDARVLAFTAATGAATALVCGLAPAWRGASGRAGGRRLTRALVVNEVALAVLLLMGAALLSKSFRELSAIEPGFATTARIRFQVALTGERYAEAEDRARFTQSLLGRLRELPGTRAAGASFRVPLDGETWTATYYPDTYEARPGEPTPGADVNVVSDGYFTAMGVPLLRGRAFNEADDGDAPRVAIIDADTAERFWPDGTAVGAKINLAAPESEPVLREIVGVVGRVKNSSLDEAGRAQLYFAASQVPTRNVSYIVAGHGRCRRDHRFERREESSRGSIPTSRSTASRAWKSFVAERDRHPAVPCAGARRVLAFSRWRSPRSGCLRRPGLLGQHPHAWRSAPGSPSALRAGRVTALVMRQAAAMVGRRDCS